MSSHKSLVTYKSDGSDSEHSDIKDNNGDQTPGENEMRSMDISPTSGDSNPPSSKVSPKEPRKNRLSRNNTCGLVSYDMDDDEDAGSIEESIESEPDEDSCNKSSNEKEDSQQLVARIDTDERFNTEQRDSDMEMESTSGGRHDEREDLKRHSGQSSATVEAPVHFQRPQGTELAYLLSRQIHATRVVELPLIPPIKASADVEAHIAKMRAQASTAREPLAATILRNKKFRNPSIYEKLVQHLNIDERGTNYPPELYDPYRFNEESYYESLAKAQDEAEKHKRVGDHDKKDGKAVQKIAKTISETKVRHTKWDSAISKPITTKSHASGTSIVIETKTMYPTNK